MNTGDLASQQALNLQTPRPTRSVILLLIDIGLADPIVKQITNVNHVLAQLLHLCYGPFLCSPTYAAGGSGAAAVVTVDNAGDTITLVGVHASELHPSDFHFADPAALPFPSAAQMVADLHAHGLLL